MRSIVLLVLVFSAACAASGSGPLRAPAGHPPSIEPSGTSLEVNLSPTRAVVSEAVAATPDAAWAALPEAWADVGLEVKEVSEATRVLGNPRVVVSRRLGEVPLSRYLECGSGLTGPFADRYRIEMLIRSAVVPGERGGARVDTYLEAQARNPEGSSNTGVQCASTGSLERAIAARVRLHTGGGGV